MNTKPTTAALNISKAAVNSVQKINKANKMNNVGSAVVANAAKKVNMNTKPTTAALNIAKTAVNSVPATVSNKKLTPNNFTKKPVYVKFNEGNGKMNAKIYKQGTLKNIYKNNKGKYVKSTGNLGNLKNYLFSGLMI